MARILIAENEEMLRALLTRALLESGHDVVAAADGVAAFEALTRDKGRFDLLLTDIKMQAMDGVALAMATAREYPDVVILLMTGYADQRERAHGLDPVIHDIIIKPFSLGTIRDAVTEALTVSAQRAH